MTKDRKACHPAVRVAATMVVTFAVAIASAGWLDPRADAINKANSLLMEGNYEEAIRLYENTVVEHPDDLTSRLNSAIALYAAGQYEDSSARFSEVLSKLSSAASSPTAERTSTKESSRLIETISRYGIGSAEYRLGLAAESLANTSANMSGSTPSTPSSSAAPLNQEALMAAIEHYRQAVSSFLGALMLDPTDEDARHNYRLAYERLEELEKLLESTESSQQKDRQDGNEGDEEQQNGQNEQSDQDQQSDQSGVSGVQPEDPGDVGSESGDDSDAGDEESQAIAVDATGNDGQPQMSLEEALRLLEMMESVEQHGVLVPLEGFADSGEYPNW